MRRKRIHKYKKRKRYLQAAQTLSLVMLGTYGISQLTTPSYALLTDQSEVNEQFSTAFVFPSTVSSMVNEAQAAARTVTDLYDSSANLLASRHDANSSDIEQIIHQIQQNASSAQAAITQSTQILSQLQAYSQQAQDEMNPIPEALLRSHIEDLGALQLSANKKRQSAARVKTYVDEGFSQAQNLQASENQTVGKFDGLLREANQLLEKQKQAEEEAKKKKLEDDQKAKEQESQTQSQTDSTTANSNDTDTPTTTTTKESDTSSQSNTQTVTSSDSSKLNPANATDTSIDTQQSNPSNTDTIQAQSDSKTVSSNPSETNNNK